jgi:nitrite reductase/ring-hydroxylating ferredoxin subunit
MSTTKTVVIPAAEVAAFPTGKAVCQMVGGMPVLIYKAADGAVKVAVNSCEHMGSGGAGDKLSKFAVDIEDAGKVVCGFHQAKLDMATMTYVSEPKRFATAGKKIEAGKSKHPEYAVTMGADGSASVQIPAAGGSGCAVA